MMFQKAILPLLLACGVATIDGSDAVERSINRRRGLKSPKGTKSPKKGKKSKKSKKAKKSTAPPVPNNRCVGMDPICASNTLSYPIFDDIIVPEDEENDFVIHPYDPYRPTWFYLTVDQSGDLEMLMDSGADVDFEAYGPFSSPTEAVSTCGNFGPSNRVDKGDLDSSEIIEITGAQAGEIYVLFVHNFDFENDSGFITLVQTGGGGSTDCTNLSQDTLRW